MTTTASTIPRMGKKRKVIRRRPVTPREQFAARLRELAGDRTTVELAIAWGCSTDAAGKYLLGKRMPDFDDLPKIAAGLGLTRWQELIPK